MSYQQLTVTEINDRVINPSLFAFYLEHIFLPIQEESGSVVIYSRSERDEYKFSKYKVQGDIDTVFSGFANQESGGPGRVGLIKLTVSAIGSRKITPKEMLFPIANLSGPIRQVIDPLFSNGALQGTYQKLPCLDSNGQASLEYFIGTTQEDLVSLGNEDAVGLNRLVKLFCQWRGFLRLTPQRESIVIETSQTPASGAAGGVAGEIAWDSDYVYECVAANT